MSHNQRFTRRAQLRQFILGLAGWSTAGIWHECRVLAEETRPVPEMSTVTLSLDVFPVLGNDGGSLRLEVGTGQPIVVSRLGNSFFAVSTRCTHNGCTVNAYSHASGRITCPCHGSQYGVDGLVLRGPAALPLTAFEAAFDGTKVTIRLPGATFGARRIEILSTTGTSSRVSLSFHATVFTSYQVHYRSDLKNSPQVIPFSLAPAGVANQLTYTNTVFNPTDPQPLVDLYLDVTGPTAFFSIVMLPYET